MTLSPDIIKRIRELLIHSGVPEGDVLEEMIDHYLTDIEKQIDQNVNHQLAIRTTYQKITKSDLSNLRKKKSKLLLGLTSILLLVFSIYLYQNKFNSAVVNPTADIENINNRNIEEAEPEGWPLKESTAMVTSKFGFRKHPIHKTIRHHNGIDIRAKIGTPVIATGDATVIKTGYNKNAGKFIILEHSSRYSTRYYHLSSIDVQQNDRVNKGCIIGEVGNSGMSSTPHLHYEIINEDEHIDPLECARA